MSTRNLDKLMAPRSVVAIGASERPGSVGAAVTRNLLGGGFGGEIHLVNRKGGEISGRPVWHSMSELLAPPDLAIIMTPAPTVPGLLEELGAKGTRAALIISAGPGTGPEAREDNARWRQKLLRTAQPHLMRLVGPN
jgi:acetyltransferase